MKAEPRHILKTCSASKQVHLASQGWQLLEPSICFQASEPIFLLLSSRYLTEPFNCECGCNLYSSQKTNTWIILWIYLYHNIAYCTESLKQHLEAFNRYLKFWEMNASSTEKQLWDSWSWNTDDIFTSPLCSFRPSTWSCAQRYHH